MYTVYYKQGCHYCDKALDLLESKSLNVVDVDITKDLGAYKKYFLEQFNVNIRTVPQITLNDEGVDVYIGGYQELMEWLK